MPISSVNIALAHHWLISYRGGEKVLEQWRLLFPESSVSTLICEKGDVPAAVAGNRVITSILQRAPRFMRVRYRLFLPLYPFAFEHLTVPLETQLVLSSDASMVKALSVPEGIPHVCYCHSPPRYIWDMVTDYSASLNPLGRAVLRYTVPFLRRRDFAAATRVSYFIANSHFVAGRIKRHYGRDACVIYPPVNTAAFNPNGYRDDFYLIVSQLVPYKMVQLATEAFSILGKRLVVIGEGPEMKELRRTAAKHIEFLGRQPFSVVKDHMERCRAFIYPQVEDFGITAVEAQAAGAPVIAFRGGGALETVVEGKTGIFFEKQTAISLADAIRNFEKENLSISAAACRLNALRFSEEKFRSEMKSFLSTKFPDKFCSYFWPAELQK